MVLLLRFFCRTRLAQIVLPLWLLAPAAASAAEASVRAWLSEAQFLIDNDTWAKTDRYYTNGFKFGGAVAVENVPEPLRSLARSTLGTALNAGFFVGQNMYTPKDIANPFPQPSDRPWAAWLYGGLVFQVIRGAKGEVLDSVELDVGMVGPAALGKEVQTNFHELVGATRPRGWHNQLKNEPGFLLAYVHKQKFGTPNVDVVPHGGLTLGTVLTLARAGGTLRIGRNLSGFGPDRIEPSGALLQNTRHTVEDRSRPDLEYYAFAGADLRYVAHNIFLDGGVFRDGPGVDKRNHVHDLSAGVSFRYRSIRFTLARVLRSEEFRTAAGGGGNQEFYSLSLAYEPPPPTGRSEIASSRRSSQ